MLHWPIVMHFLVVPPADTKIDALVGGYCDDPVRSGDTESSATENSKIDRPSDSHLIALSVTLSKRALDRKSQATEDAILFESVLLKH